MTIKFNIKYSTVVGQELFLLCDFLPENDGRQKMDYASTEEWTVSLNVDPSRFHTIHYKFMLKDLDGIEIEEGGGWRKLNIENIKSNIELINSWNNPGFIENVFYTAPFQKILLKRKKIRGKKHRGPFTHEFRLKAPLLNENETVCLIGSSAELHHWDSSNPLILQPSDEWWKIKLSLNPGEFVRYKYGKYNTKEERFLEFEQGEDRMLHVPSEIQAVSIVEDGFLRFPANSWKGAGVAIPVFSLRSKNSFGIGEFNDLKLLADWAKKTGIKMIQILPVNDTTATFTKKDSYPYAAISAFALHPVYINLEILAGRKYAELLKPLKKKQKQLNDLEEIDFETALKFKVSVAKEIYQLQKDHFQKEKEFKDFFDSNRHWLEGYAAFAVLRDKYGTADFTKWKTHRQYNRLLVARFVSPSSSSYDEVRFNYFLQYHLHLQLKSAAEYLNKNGILLKGDIPIGIYRYGADAWMNADLFHMDQQSGAPPDSFALAGQNWGFPTYNWEKMEQDGFKWWQRRFLQMSNYFDAFRIDHILGFFRIWSIPLHAVEGIMGRFVPAIPVHIHEFGKKEMWFNYHRLCMPFINDAVLWDMFGPNKDKFLPYLNSTGNGQYELKEEFNTQLKVKEYFGEKEDDENNQHIRQGLFNLISNYILSEEEGSDGTKFHFRFNMHETLSYKYLDAHMQYHIKELYNDYYFYRQDDFWRKEAYRKLPALKNSTNMLICGEDLGLVPDSVPQVMKELGILSLEVQRMPKILGHRFFRPVNSEYLAVVTPSTHDMSTIRGWWKEDREITNRFYNEELQMEGEAPEDCPDWICKKIIQMHLFSPAMWSIFQLQDILSIDNTIRRSDPDAERINIPADPDHYWNYRMHLNLEDLIKEKDFNSGLKKEIEDSRRN